MTLTPEITTDRATVYRSKWRDLAATLPDNMPGASLAIVDGPYNMRKADWDTFLDWEHFVAWYRPELEELTRVLVMDAAVYLWGSDESEGYLRPLMRALGWEFCGSLVWEKTGAHPARISAATASKWADVTERCSHWRRGSPHFQGIGTQNVWKFDGNNGMRSERLRTGERVSAINKETATGIAYQCQETLHPCQKPLAFYDRLIRSSSRPGDTVLEPYGGTLRAAVACHRLPPSEARRAIVCEPHGPYIEAVRPSLEWVPPTVDGLGLFG
jgi:site-specific DNA-methyltransferase (adenine-specific)